MRPGVDPVRHPVALGFRDEALLVKRLVIVVEPKLFGGAAAPLRMGELFLFSQREYTIFPWL